MLLTGYLGGAVASQLRVGNPLFSKEVVGGYAVYQVGSKEEVLAWARRFMQIHVDHWPGWEGVSEVRQIFDPADFRPAATTGGPPQS